MLLLNPQFSYVNKAGTTIKLNVNQLNVQWIYSGSMKNTEELPQAVLYSNQTLDECNITFQRGQDAEFDAVQPKEEIHLIFNDGVGTHDVWCYITDKINKKHLDHTDTYLSFLPLAGEIDNYSTAGSAPIPTQISTNDSRVVITGSGTFDVNIDTTGIGGGTSDHTVDFPVTQSITVEKDATENELVFTGWEVPANSHTASAVEVTRLTSNTITFTEDNSDPAQPKINIETPFIPTTAKLNDLELLSANRSIGINDTSKDINLTVDTSFDVDEFINDYSNESNIDAGKDAIGDLKLTASAKLNSQELVDNDVSIGINDATKDINLTYTAPATTNDLAFDTGTNVLTSTVNGVAATTTIPTAGGGVTYTFTDTTDGWEVNGSDGSSFTHTDKGGSGSGVTEAVVWTWANSDKTSVALIIAGNTDLSNGSAIYQVTTTNYRGVALTKNAEGRFSVEIPVTNMLAAMGVYTILISTQAPADPTTIDFEQVVGGVSIETPISKDSYTGDEISVTVNGSNVISAITNSPVTSTNKIATMADITGGNTYTGDGLSINIDASNVVSAITQTPVNNSNPLATIADITTGTGTVNFLKYTELGRRYAMTMNDTTAIYWLQYRKGTDVIVIPGSTMTLNGHVMTIYLLDPDTVTNWVYSITTSDSPTSSLQVGMFTWQPTEDFDLFLAFMDNGQTNMYTVRLSGNTESNYQVAYYNTSSTLIYVNGTGFSLNGWTSYTFPKASLNASNNNVFILPGTSSDQDTSTAVRIISPTEVSTYWEQSTATLTTNVNGATSSVALPSSVNLSFANDTRTLTTTVNGTSATTTIPGGGGGDGTVVFDTMQSLTVQTGQSNAEMNLNITKVPANSTTPTQTGAIQFKSDTLTFAKDLSDVNNPVVRLEVKPNPAMTLQDVTVGSNLSGSTLLFIEAPSNEGHTVGDTIWTIEFNGNENLACTATTNGANVRWYGTDGTVTYDFTSADGTVWITDSYVWDATKAYIVTNINGHNNNSITAGNVKWIPISTAAGDTVYVVDKAHSGYSGATNLSTVKLGDDLSNFTVTFDNTKTPENLPAGSTIFHRVLHFENNDLLELNYSDNGTDIECISIYGQSAGTWAPIYDKVVGWINNTITFSSGAVLTRIWNAELETTDIDYLDVNLEKIVINPDDLKNTNLDSLIVEGVLKAGDKAIVQIDETHNNHKTMYMFDSGNAWIFQTDFDWNETPRVSIVNSAENDSDRYYEVASLGAITIGNMTTPLDPAHQYAWLLGLNGVYYDEIEDWMPYGMLVTVDHEGNPQTLEQLQSAGKVPYSNSVMRVMFYDFTDDAFIIDNDVTVQVTLKMVENTLRNIVNKKDGDLAFVKEDESESDKPISLYEYSGEHGWNSWIKKIVWPAAADLTQYSKTYYPVPNNAIHLSDITVGMNVRGMMIYLDAPLQVNTADEDYHSYFIAITSPDNKNIALQLTYSYWDNVHQVTLDYHDANIGLHNKVLANETEVLVPRFQFPDNGDYIVGGISPELATDINTTIIPFANKADILAVNCEYLYKNAGGVTPQAIIDNTVDTASVTRTIGDSGKVEFSAIGSAGTLLTKVVIDGVDYNASYADGNQTLILTSANPGYATQVSYLDPTSNTSITYDLAANNYQLAGLVSRATSTITFPLNGGGTVDLQTDHITGVFFDQRLTDTTLIAVPNAFCAAFEMLSAAIKLPESVTSIGGNFLDRCQTYNNTVYIPASVTTIGSLFMAYCDAFNQPIGLPTNLQSLGSEFLAYSGAFNQRIIVPDQITTIPANFLIGCGSFNKPIDLSNCTNLTFIDEGFLTGCSAFNQPLTLPNSLTHIANGFLIDCTSFNIQLNIPANVNQIEYNFMDNCSMYNHPLTLPDNLSSVGDGFLVSCDNMYVNNQTITIGNNPATIFNDDGGGTITSQNLSIITNSNGITIIGDDKAAFLAKFPNGNYRKLI